MTNGLSVHLGERKARQRFRSRNRGRWVEENLTNKSVANLTRAPNANHGTGIAGLDANECRHRSSIMLHQPHVQQNMPTRTGTNQPLPDSDRKRVLIVDDQPLFVSGLTSLVNAQPDLITCCAASSAPLALETLQRCPADIVIVDYYLPGVNGIESIKMVLAVQSG